MNKKLLLILIIGMFLLAGCGEEFLGKTYFCHGIGCEDSLEYQDGNIIESEQALYIMKNNYRIGTCVMIDETHCKVKLLEKSLFKGTPVYPDEDYT